MHLDEWRPVEDFPGYSVNPLGQVKKDSKASYILRTRVNQYGFPYVGLMRNGRQCIRSLPRLVATAYITPPSDVFDTPINLNGDRTDCSVDNLMWRPRWYAVLYMNQFEERYDYPIDEPVKVSGETTVYPNSFEAAINYGLLEREVVLSILNRTPAWPTYQDFELANRQ